MEAKHRDLYVIQQEAGDDGLYHWKLFLSDEGTTKTGIWYDVVWSANNDEGSRRRGPRPYAEALSKGLIDSHLIGSIASADVDKFHKVVVDTYRPQYSDGNDKNCQTWLRDVVSGLVAAGIIGADALTKVDAVPKSEPETSKKSESEKSESEKSESEKSERSVS